MRRRNSRKTLAIGSILVLAAVTAACYDADTTSGEATDVTGATPDAGGSSTTPTPGANGNEGTPGTAGNQGGDDAGDAAGNADAGGDGATPDAGPPPLPPCGAAAASKCALGRACAGDTDCTSGICSASGPTKGTCIAARSCTGAPGADARCGITQSENCCAAPAIPAGSFTNQDIDGTKQLATLSAYRLDAFEITVGRLRAFVEATGGDLRGHAPAAGAAANAHVPASGWRKSFDARLPQSRAEVDARLTTACAVAGGTTFYGSSTWTTAPGANEDKPVTCIDWYTAFAFCAWDGGRLPTDAEWSMAAVGGTETRKYPWGNDDPYYETHKDVFVSLLVDRSDGNTLKFTEGSPFRQADDGALQISRAGKHTERGRWGHADLGGNVLEWIVDRANFLSGPCTDCADVAWPDPPQNNPGQFPPDWVAKDAGGNPIGDEFSTERAAPDGERFLRSSSFQGAPNGHPIINFKNRHYYPVWRTYGAAGARCAR